MLLRVFFYFKQKTAYEMRISDWSSDVCSSDLAGATLERFHALAFTALKTATPPADVAAGHQLVFVGRRGKHLLLDFGVATYVVHLMQGRSEESRVGNECVSTCKSRGSP